MCIFLLWDQIYTTCGFKMHFGHDFRPIVMKFFSILKWSNNGTITIPMFFNTYMLTLNSAQQKVSKKLIFAKIEGGGESKSHKIDYFFGLTEISGRFSGQWSQKSAGSNFIAQFTTNFRGSEFGPKEKKLDLFKVRWWRNLKNRVHPPPPLQKLTLPDRHWCSAMVRVTS